MHVRIVCPEHYAYEGEAAFVALPSADGELGVAPHHASEICSVSAGYVRICDEHMGSVSHTFAVDGGYAEITDEEVVILAERAADLAAVPQSEIEERLRGFEEQLGNLSADDARRAYLYNEIAWCKLLRPE